MKNRFPFLLFAPLALAAAACGDDSAGTGGSGQGGDTGNAASSSSGNVASSSSGNGPSSSSGSTSDGGGGSTGDGGGGSTGDGGSTGEGGFTVGDPIDADPEVWTWVDFPESRCINDTPTGIGVNLAAGNDTDLVLFLQGGNACFNQTSCFVTANTDGYDEAKFDADGSLNADLFQRVKENDFGDWSYAYVPYCTGDVHGGHRQNADVGGAIRNFHGYRNMTRFLERLVATFPNAERVLLTGVSAGGFGAAYNYSQVKEAFGDGVRVYLLDDSGPPMAEEFVPACLQRHFRDTWGFDGTLPEGCADCFAGDTFTEEFMVHIQDTWPDERFGLISSEEDTTIRNFWGYGNDDCANLDDAIPPAYAGEMYTAGLLDLRDRVGGPNFALFMPPGGRHVWLNNDSGLSTTVEGSPELRDWATQLVDDDVAWQSWPAP